MPELPQISSIKTPQAGVVDVRRSSRFPSVYFPLVIVTVLLVCYGLLVVYSAVSTDPDYQFSRQLMGIGIGLIAMVIFWRFDYRRLADAWKLLLVINIVLILSPHLPVIGVTTMGATSWIKIGIQLQPGEFAKITVILMDASLMARHAGRLSDPIEYLKTLGLMCVPFICVMTQPDLGTGLVYLFIAAVALVVGGTRPKLLIITLFVCIGLVVVVFLLDEVIKNATGSYALLKQYQRNRLLVFLNQNSTDTSDEGYNLQQAMIAIGSGGLFGQGYMQGSQHALGILPEAPTDFIFCVLAEEFGFVGVVVLLGLYIALVVIGFKIASASSDMFGLVLSMSVVGMWLFQIMENIGMDCGLMPITGIPLPFMSYGSSFMMVNFALLGLLSSVWSRNAQNVRKAEYAASR